MKKWDIRQFMVFFILSATVAIAYQIPYLRYTFYDQMVETFGLNNTQMAMIATAVNVISAISYPIGGILADKFSTRSLYIITLAAFVVLTIIFAFTTNYVLLLAIHALYGFFGIATLWSAYLNGIRSLGTAENQSTLFGSSEATRGIVQTVFGFLFLGIIGANASVAAGIQRMLLVSAAIILLILVLAIIFMPKTANAAQADDADGAESYSFIDVLKNPGVWIMILLIAGAYSTWSQGNSYLTTYTVQVLGISTSLASTLGIIRSYIIVFVAGFLGGFVLDRFKYKGKGMILLFGCIIALVVAIMATNKVVPLCIVLTLIVAFFANIIKSTYWSVMGQAGIPEKMTPIATGVISFIAFLPDYAVAPICGVWLDNATEAGNVAAGFNKIFVLLIGLAVVGVVASLLLIQRTKKMEAAGQ